MTPPRPRADNLKKIINSGDYFPKCLKNLNGNVNVENSNTNNIANTKRYKYKNVISVESKQDPKLIKCYNERTGGKFQQCWRDDGFETCFTKFSPGEN